MESINKSESIIDKSMIEMLSNIDFSGDSLIVNHEDMGSLLRQCRSCLLKANFEELEEKAIELSNKSLLLGAKKMLKDIYDLQNFARLKDKVEISRVLDCLDFDWVLARDEIDSLSK